MRVENSLQDIERAGGDGSNVCGTAAIGADERQCQSLDTDQLRLVHVKVFENAADQGHTLAVDLRRSEALHGRALHNPLWTDNVDDEGGSVRGRDFALQLREKVVDCR